MPGTNTGTSGISFGGQQRTALLSVMLIGMLGAAATAGATSFSDQTAAAGITFVHQSPGDIEWGEQHGGTAVGDYNRDGWPDLFVAGGGMQPDALYINNQDGTFTDQAASWGFTELYRGNGVAAGDVNGDGWDDIYITSHGPMSGPPVVGDHRLYINTGNGGFVETALAAGVNSTSDRPEGYSPNFGDYDLDGDLDLWVAGWHTGLFIPGRSRLFRNRGDGTFDDVTADAGVGTPNEDIVGQFSGAFVDMNGDRYPELLIAGDWGNSHYLRNNGDGTFTDIDIFLPDRPWNGMGHAVGDVNRDGLMDWFITAAWPAFAYLGPEGNRLYINNGNDSFLGLPDTAGVEDGGWGWGAAIFDADQDGWQDVMMTNGWPYDDELTGASFINEPTYLFRNQGNETFDEIAVASGLNHIGQGRGLAHLDYDRDGDLDVVITAYNEPLRLFRNDIGGASANWLQVAVDNSAHPVIAPDGVGTRVSITSAGGSQYAQIGGVSHFLATSEVMAHFGLGADTTIETLEILWADGFRTVLNDVPANQRLEIAVEPPLRGSLPVVVGGAGEVIVEGAGAGEEVHLFTSPYGAGRGVCLAYFGGRCLGMRGARYAGSGTTDADGRVAISVAAPPFGELTRLSVQAMIRRGTDGAASIQTNVLSVPVIDPDEG